MTTFRDNRKDILQLYRIHRIIGGEDRGRRLGLEVLNRSATVLITACWEAFIEDLATEAYDFLLKHSTDYNQIPSRVRVEASKSLKQSNDEREVWQLAGNGWKDVLVAHRDKVIKKYIGNLNTPKCDQIQALFSNLLGIDDITRSWYWQKNSVDNSKAKLDRYVSVRGAIAHRTRFEDALTLAWVESYLHFIEVLSKKTEKAVDAHLKQLVGTGLSKLLVKKR